MKRLNRHFLVTTFVILNACEGFRFPISASRESECRDSSFREVYPAKGSIQNDMTKCDWLSLKCSRYKPLSITLSARLANLDKLLADLVPFEHPDKGFWRTLNPLRYRLALFDLALGNPAAHFLDKRLHSVHVV